MIRISNLSKSFGRRKVLKNISFDIHPGERVGLLGPNGAGKTTTLRILAGFLKADCGTVTINNLEVRSSLIKIKRYLGYLPETAPYYNDFSVEEYLSFVAEAKGFRGTEKAKHVDAALKRFDLEARSAQVMRTLSRGFQKRVCLAQAMINDPAILILDEPTNSLDPLQISDFRKYYFVGRAEKITILSSHILSEVTAVCTKVIMIDCGEIRAIKHIEEISNLEDFYLDNIRGSAEC